MFINPVSARKTERAKGTGGKTGERRSKKKTKLKNQTPTTAPWGGETFSKRGGPSTGGKLGQLALQLGRGRANEGKKSLSEKKKNTKHRRNWNEPERVGSRTLTRSLPSAPLSFPNDHEKGPQQTEPPIGKMQNTSESELKKNRLRGKQNLGSPRKGGCDQDRKGPPSIKRNCDERRSENGRKGEKP